MPRKDEYPGGDIPDVRRTAITENSQAYYSIYLKFGVAEF